MNKPILFNTEMVQAILEGRKTVTRRIVKSKESEIWQSRFWDCERSTELSPYQTGDVLWVRETYAHILYDDGEPCDQLVYKASDEAIGFELTQPDWKWHPSIHMPKAAARIFLRVTDVRAERLNEMTAEDAEREGIRKYTKDGTLYKHATSVNQWVKYHCEQKMDGSWWQSMPESPVDAFKYLWNSTIKPADLDRYGWDANPWVWVISFERTEKPEDFA